jgi:hypothetical protein
MSVSAAVPSDASGSPLRTRRDGDVVLLTCNDLHLSDVPPAARLDNYVDEMFRLLDQIRAVAEKLDADAVCIAGDIFHSKQRPMGTALLGRLVDWCKTLQARGTEILVVPGNHDIRYNNLATLPDQPLGLMLKAEVVWDVSRFPWRDSKGGWVTVQGIAYPTAMDLQQWMRIEPCYTKYRVILAHCFASLSGGMVYGETEHRYADLYEACPADVYVFGHDHSDGGVAKVVTATRPTFINLGALSRGTIGNDDITRDIHLGIVRIGEAVSVSRVRLNAIPASELFDLTAKAEQTAQARQIDAFIADLETTLASLDSTAPVATHLGVLSLPDEVKTRMQRYIDEVEQG